MPGIYEYTLQMNDRASGTLQKLTGSSFEAIQKLRGLQDRVETLNRNTKDFGSSIYNLKQRIDILQEERDLIDPGNLAKIRQYNKEIKGLATQIATLENTSGGKFKTWTKDAFSQIPGAGLMTNPIVMAGAGVAAVSKLSISWADGMAKINTTAQLPKKELDKLGKTIKKLGVDAGASLGSVPDAYEKILSQTGDVALSTDILAKALKGAKAGYTDVNIVSGAVAQSLSAIGKENTNAQEVLDTLFAAKRVGAGEFADFARYLPTLFAASKNIGAGWKETAGLFAYMTGKGQDAANSAMLIQNAYNALGKKEITDGLAKVGVNVFDDAGKMREMVDIFTDLSKYMEKFGDNDKMKTAFLENIGLRDQQAKAAFSILTDETEKLQAAMDATASATGELAAALEKTNTPGNKMKEIWSNITGTGLGLGDMINAILNPLLDGLLAVFKGIYLIVDGLGSAWNWWIGLLKDGNPWITGLTVLLIGLSAALAVNALIANAASIGYGLAAAASGIWSAATWVVTAAQWALNAALSANPLGLIVIVIMAVAAALYAAWQKSEKFRGAILGTLEVIKGFGVMLKEYVVDRIKGIISGLGGMASAIGKLFKGDFKGAVEDGKNALSDLAGIDAAKNAVESGKKLGEKFRSGYQKGVESFQKDKEEPQESIIEKLTKQPLAGNNPAAALNAGNNPAASVKNSVEGRLSLGIPQNHNASNSYSAITSNLRKMAAAVTIPVGLAVGATSAVDAVAADTAAVNEVAAVQPTNVERQGKTIHIDRFTDKIEIHVTGVDAPEQAAEQVRVEVEKALAEILNV